MMTAAVSRRRLAALLAAGFAGACASRPSVAGFEGRLAARPGESAASISGRGLFRLPAWPQPLIYVPPELDTSKPAPFILVLHGGGSDGDWTLNRMLKAAHARGVILLAPDAQRYTWDVIRDFRDHRGQGAPRFGDDTLRVDASLKQAFEQFTIDPRRVAIGGFSDGASYALSLGPRNDAVFSHIMAFSPGGVAPFEDAARARVFISHGRQDPMLPFDNTVEGIIPGFRARGFDVTFETFKGVHAFRDEEIAKAMDWFLGQ